VLDINWYNEFAQAVDWHRSENLLACRIDGSMKEIHSQKDDWDFYLLFNPGLYDQYFTLCDPPKGQHWTRIIDTSLPSPEDFREPGNEEQLIGTRYYLVESRSMVVLISQR